jgi:hypothetical protein
MIKKLLILVGGAAVVGYLALGTNVFSYIGTTAGVIKDEINSSIPVEFELKRAEKLIGEIIPEIQASKKVVAQEEVEVEYLRNDIASLDQDQTKLHRRVMVQKSALEGGATKCSFGGRTYTRTQVEGDLAETFERYRNNDALLESKRRLLESREASLVAAKQKLERVKVEKEQMENLVETLYAKLRQVQAMEASSSTVVLNDGALSRAKDLLARCQKRLDVAQRMIANDDADVRIEIDLDLEEASPRDIVHEVNEYFAIESTDAASARAAAAAGH